MPVKHFFDTFATSAYIRHVSELTIPTWTTGDRLRKSRRDAGVEQTEMAEFLGVSKGLISQWENDLRQPRIGMLRGWAHRCGVPLDWIRYGTTDLDDSLRVIEESSNACTRWLGDEQQLRLPLRFLRPVA